MRGKFTTKTIIIVIVALLVLAAAVTSTVVFLKDSGEASAAQEQDLLDAIQQNEDSQEKNDDTTKDGENLPELGDEEERANQLNTGNTNNTNNDRDDNDTLEEPAPSTVERERVISETTTLGWNNIGLNSKIGANELGIVYNNLEYKVEYYFDEILAEDLSITIGENSKGKIIDTYEEKVKVGYKLDKVENFPLTITENEESNVIEVYYEKDEEQVKDISYTVKYYIEDKEQESDRKVITEIVWINAEETMTFDSSLLNKEYVGYKKVGTNPETVGEIVNNGDVIEVYYKKDEEQVKDISYTVKYYIEDKEQESDRKVITETVWINAEETMEFDSSLLDKAYVGYKKVGTNPDTVESTVNNGDVIEVYYEKASYRYTIYYYKDSIDGANLLGRISNSVEYGTRITADTTKYLPETGYMFKGTAPSMTIGENAAENILNVVYTKVTNLSYTIKYLEKGTNKELKTETISNQEYNKVIKVSDIEIPEKITSSGKEYKYSNEYKTSQEPPITGQIVIGADLSKNVITLYYERPEIKSEKTSSVVTNATIPGKAYAGDEITYTIKVWNIGSGDKEVKVEDNIPAGTTVISDSASSKSGKVTVSNGKVTWIVNVPANTSKANSKVLTFKVTINKEATGTIKNTAKIDGKTGPSDGDGIGVIKPANITVSKVSSVVDKSNAAEKGDKLKYTITAKNTGDDLGIVIIKDTDLKTLIDSGVIEFIEKTGYTGSNEDLIAALAGNGVSLTVQGNSEVKVTYTVKVLAKVGTTIKNKVEVVSGGKVDEEKEETINVVEKTATITENTETIKGKNIVIVIDLSASMNDIIGGVSKLEAAKDAAQGFITKIFEKDPNGTSGTKLSLVTFNYGGNETSSGDTAAKYVGTHVFTDNSGNSVVTNKAQAEAMNSAIEAIELDSDLGTNMGAALIKAEQQLGVLRQGNDNEQVIIFLGDGDPSTGGNENTETAINNKATALKNAGVEIYTIGFGLHQEIDVWCPAILNSSCDKEHYKTSGAWDILSIFRYHKEAVNEEDAIRILRNMASGTTAAEKDKYARSSTGAQSLIDTFNSISSSIAIDTDTNQSTNAKVELSSTIYADETHPITIKVNGDVDTTLTALPTDATGKVIKEGTKYYLDLTKFDADVEVSITYFSK